MVKLSALLLLLLSRAHPASSATPSELRHAFFIVATNGNDSWSGNRPSINPSHTDGPFATLQHAIDAARTWRSSPGVATNAIVGIFLRSGVYYLDKPLVLGPEDSGLVISSYSTEKPIISGGRRIFGWRPVSVNGKNAWAADIPDAKNGKWVFHQLWVNGQRATRARYPAEGYLKVAEVPDKTSHWTIGNSRFRFGTGDLKLWKGITEGELVVMHAWVESRLPIASLDEANRFISFKKRSVLPLKAGDVYYLEGIPDFLTQPGDWCLDSSGGTVYYLPRPGETINRTEVVAPVLSQIVRLEGAREKGLPISRIRFKGLSFSHSEWYFPSGFAAGRAAVLGVSPSPSAEVGGFGQADIGVPGAVWGQGVQSCSWKGCTFSHLGTYGLELGLGCDGNVISRCTVFDSAGGIKIGGTFVSKRAAEQTADNEISDCNVYDGGQFFLSGYGIWLGITGNNRVVHNDIHDFYSVGISVGWTWGYWPTPATNNLIAFNHVHHIGAKSDGRGAMMSDLGGIYTLGIQSGTKILNNVVHDITALLSPGIGIYLDEGSSGILVESNVVYHTTDCCFGLHFGATNAVVNNIFAFGRDRQLHVHNPEPHLGLVFMRNIVYFDSGILLDGAWSSNQCRVDGNTYFDIRPGLAANRKLFNGLTWQQWRTSGQDRDSLIADPLFRNPGQNDFLLASNSPALKLVFGPIDVSGVGVRPR